VTIYQTPSGQLHRSRQQVEKFDQESYFIHKFMDAKVRITVARLRVVDDSNGARPPDMFKLFSVSVENILTTDPDGAPLAEPAFVVDPDATRTFRSQAVAERHYNTFLAKYTKSHFDETTGELVEVGNKFDPDIPAEPASPAAAQSFGSWA